MTCNRLAILSTITALVLAAPSYAQPRPSDVELFQFTFQGVPANAQSSDAMLAQPAAREAASGMRLAESKARVDRKYEVPKAPRMTEQPAQSSRDQFRRSPSASTTSANGSRCTSCRSTCNRRWRTNCGNTSTCKKSYSGCMRECWQEYCRS